MADNPLPTPPPSPNPGPRITPPLKGTGLTGSLKNPTTRLPIRTGSGGKIVVMLSSVAKPPPAGTQQLPSIVLPNQRLPRQRLFRLPRPCRLLLLRSPRPPPPNLRRPRTRLHPCRRSRSRPLRNWRRRPGRN